MLSRFFCVYLGVNAMLQLQNSLQFIHVDTVYIKALHNVCSEVYYREHGYDNKPYIGILLNAAGYEYVIPLTSAKEKHKTWRDSDKNRYLLYEYASIDDLSVKDIWVPAEQGKVKHILAAIDIRKMIPVKKELYAVVNLNDTAGDSLEMKKYKDLLNKEYALCLKIKNQLLRNCSILYNRQMQTRIVSKYCCNFRLLEHICDEYVR